MDDLDHAIIDAWNRAVDRLKQDPRETARRASRRLSPTLTRPLRPFCLAIRASDTRLETLATSRTDQPHQIHLRAEDARRLTAPVRLPWPGIDWTTAADRLGRHPESLRTWINNGLLNTRRYNARACRKRGHPVPHVWTPSPLDPAANTAQPPDPIYGTLWPHLANNIPEALNQRIIRTPHHTPYTNPTTGTTTPRQRGHRFQCPGRYTHTPAITSFHPTRGEGGPAQPDRMRGFPAKPGQTPDRERCLHHDELTPLPRGEKLAAKRPNEGVSESSPVTEGGGGGGVAEGDRGGTTSPRAMQEPPTLTHIPCPHQARTLYLPTPTWTIAHALNLTTHLDLPNLATPWTPGLIDPTLTHNPPKPSRGRKHARPFLLARNANEEVLVPPSPPERGWLAEGEPVEGAQPLTFACRHCWNLRNVSLTTTHGWNLFITHLSAGLLYGHDLPRTRFLNPATKRKRAHISKPRPTPRRDQVGQLFTRGLTHKQIAKALNIAPSTVASHIKKLHQHHNTHNRDQLREALSMGTPRASKQSRRSFTQDSITMLSTHSPEAI